jgi:hypothetical protein
LRDNQYCFDKAQVAFTQPHIQRYIPRMIPIQIAANLLFSHASFIATEDRRTFNAVRQA